MIGNFLDQVSAQSHPSLKAALMDAEYCVHGMPTDLEAKREVLENWRNFAEEQHGIPHGGIHILWQTLGLSTEYLKDHFLCFDHTNSPIESTSQMLTVDDYNTANTEGISAGIWASGPEHRWTYRDHLNTLTTFSQTDPNAGHYLFLAMEQSGEDKSVLDYAVRAAAYNQAIRLGGWFMGNNVIEAGPSGLDMTGSYTNNQLGWSWTRTTSQQHTTSYDKPTHTLTITTQSQDQEKTYIWLERELLPGSALDYVLDGQPGQITPVDRPSGRLYALTYPPRTHTARIDLGSTPCLSGTSPYTPACEGMIARLVGRKIGEIWSCHRERVMVCICVFRIHAGVGYRNGSHRIGHEQIPEMARCGEGLLGDFSFVYPCD